MRYVYVKHGDAVEQTRRVLLTGRHEGPDAYLGAFLAAHVADEVLVLCRFRPARRFALGGVVAESCPGPGIGGQWVSRIIAALRIGARILTWRPDRILCSGDREALWVSVLAARALRVPIVASRHSGMPARQGLRRLSHLLEAFALRHCDGVICHGPFLVDSARQAGIATHRIREFSVDLGEFAATPMGRIPEDLALFTRKFPCIAMYVGRMQDAKGILDLLSACASLGQTGHDRLGLVYVGDGEHVARLRDQIARMGMKDGVLLMGEVPHGRLLAVLKCATVIVTPTRPSVQEGRCKVVLEAFVAGVPVVAPDFAAFPHAVAHDENGLLFAPADVGSLADAIARITCDAALLARLRQGATATASRLLEGTEPDFVSAVTAAFAETDVGASAQPRMQ